MTVRGVPAGASMPFSYQRESRQRSLGDRERRQQRRPAVPAHRSNRACRSHGGSSELIAPITDVTSPAIRAVTIAGALYGTASIDAGHDFATPWQWCGAPLPARRR